MLGDIGADAVRDRMLGSVEGSARWPTPSARIEPPAVVVDPVMIARAAARLLDTEAVAAVRGGSCRAPTC